MQVFNHCITKIRAKKDTNAYKACKYMRFGEFEVFNIFDTTVQNTGHYFRRKQWLDAKDLNTRA